MMMALLIVLIVNLATLALILGACAKLGVRLQLLQDDVSKLVVRNIPVDVGGRLAPSPAELLAAKNRMDRLGVAHPGGPG